MKECPHPGDIEGQFLVDVARAFVGGRGTLAAPEPMNWARLERLAAANRLMPVLMQVVDGRQIPACVHQRWTALQIGVDLHYQRARNAAIHVCGALQAAGIPSALTRGMALAEWVYREPSLRPMVDADVLVPSTARHRVLDALAGARFGTPKRLRSQFAYQVDGVVFEIHWCFLTPKRYRDIADWDAWFDRRVRLAAGADLYRLDATDELIALLLHGFVHHQLDPLQQWVDVALVSRSDAIDWDHFSRWVEDAGVGRMLWSALGMIDELLKLDLQQRCPPLRSEVARPGRGVLAAYVAPLLGQDCLASFLGRRRHLLWVAPDARRKFAQYLRFFSVDEMGALARAARPATWMTRPDGLNRPRA